MSFAFYLLASHPEIQEKLYDEIKEVFEDTGTEEKREVGSHAPKRVTLDMLKKMPYLDGVVFETLRLFPAANFDARETARDDILPNGVRNFVCFSCFHYSTFILFF